MKRYAVTLVFVVALIKLAACGGSPAAPTEEAQATGGVEATLAPTAGPTATPTEVAPYVQTEGAFVAIDEIGLGPEGWISLTNFTSVPVTTKGLYLCQGADCFALPDAVIEAGETGRITVGDGEGLEGVIASKATIGELKPADGEVALFSSDKFDDPKAILVYLQWGSTPHALTDLAVEAGLWIKTGYAPTSPNATRLYRIEESGWWMFEE